MEKVVKGERVKTCSTSSLSKSSRDWLPQIPAPSASIPFLPNLNQHLALEPLEGPRPKGLTRPSLFRVPRNWVLSLTEKDEELKDLEAKHEWVAAVVHGMEAMSEFQTFSNCELLNSITPSIHSCIDGVMICCVLSSSTFSVQEQSYPLNENTHYSMD